MTPACHNRMPVAPGRMEHGYDRATGQAVAVWLSNAWFTDRCATWDGVGIGPNGERYPQAHGWDCAGGRWLPEAFK